VDPKEIEEGRNGNRTETAFGIICGSLHNILLDVKYIII
jgi:hypothetical protein